MQVQWGILGTATIAREAVIPAMLKSPYHERLRVAAVASRDHERAAAVAREFGIERAYGSYAALLEDPAIDAVYIPLPNHLHVPYSIRALEAGKHVLCEKPIALNAAEAEELAAASRRNPELKLMEAFMYRLHPQWQWAPRSFRRAASAKFARSTRGSRSSKTIRAASSTTRTGAEVD